jgi:hypothetical protein
MKRRRERVCEAYKAALVVMVYASIVGGIQSLQAQARYREKQLIDSFFKG